MSTQKVFGHTTLYDSLQQIIHYGEIAFLVAGDRSEIQVRNQDTGETVTVGRDNPLVAELIAAIREVYESADLRSASPEDAA